MCAAVLVIAVGFLLTTGLGGWLSGNQQTAGGPASTVAGNLQSPPPATIPEEIPVASAPETSEAPAASTLNEGDTAAPTMSGAPPRLLLPAMSGSDASPSPPADEATSESVAVDETAYGYGDTTAEPAPPVESPDRYTDPTTDTAAGGATASIPQTPPQIVPIPVASLPEAAPLESGATTSESATGPDAGAMSEAPPLVDAEPVIDLAESVAALEEPPAPPADLGTYFDGKNVLLHVDAATGAWLRMAPHSSLRPGDKLLALPAFYPKLTLASGLHLKLAGGTQIALDSASTDSNEPVIDVAFGKLVIVNTTNDENKLRLTVGEEDASVRLGLARRLQLTCSLGMRLERSAYVARAADR